MKPIEAKVQRLEKQASRHRAEITRLLASNESRRACIRRLHAMLNHIGWCYQCDNQMDVICDGDGEVIGWRCERCPRAYFFGATDERD